MKIYYVSTNPQHYGKHEIHTTGCSYLPGFLNRKPLGEFPTLAEAILEARKTFMTAKACKNCCNLLQIMQ